MKVSDKIKTAYSNMKEGKATGKKISDKGDGEYSRSQKKYAKKAWETMQQNKDVPMVKRMLIDNPPMYAQDTEKKEPVYSTHLMGTVGIDGKHAVVPELGFYDNGFVRDESFDTQIEKGDYVKFKKKKEARKFAEGSWKDALALNKK